MECFKIENMTFNYPETEKPTLKDISFTVEMERACSVLGVDLLEHMVYADGECHPIMMKAKLNSTVAIEYDHMEV